MLSDKVVSALREHNLALDLVDASPMSNTVRVGVVDADGTRWIGHASRMPEDMNQSLERAFVDATKQYRASRECDTAARF